MEENKDKSNCSAKSDESYSQCMSPTPEEKKQLESTGQDTTNDVKKDDQQL